VPVIGQINDFEFSMLKRNPDEVEKIFLIPLERLCDPQYVKHTQFRVKGMSSGYSMPVYTAGAIKFWGMTAAVTHFFLCSLLPKRLYNRRLPYLNRYDNSSS
jgi:nudix motif 8